MYACVCECVCVYIYIYISNYLPICLIHFRVNKLHVLEAVVKGFGNEQDITEVSIFLETVDQLTCMCRTKHIRLNRKNSSSKEVVCNNSIKTLL